MQPTTFQYDTDLSAINSVLAAIGQAPITTINYENPEIHLISNLIQETNRDLQSEGWVFNTERDYPLLPDADGIIHLPENVIRMDKSFNAVIRTTNVIKRDDKLYDKLNHTFIFSGEQRMDITWLFPFEEIPLPFQRYVVATASARAATQIVTNPELTQLLGGQVALTRAACMEYECNQGDYTFFGTPEHTAYSPYKPFRALFR